MSNKIDLRALTVKQPWAWAIAHGGKNIENRNQYTYQRGTIAIHAGAAWHWDRKMPRGVAQPDESDLHLSAIIAIADLIECVDYARSKWFKGDFGYVLDNIRPLKKPVPCKGALSFWRVPAAQIMAIRKQLSAKDNLWTPLHDWRTEA